ncbi:DUF5906 domain-containing protein [Mesorhizobium sp. B2-5-7]|uniref:phage NrS-1 polymerase family protein n=1 Tax=Mesorhizobium sp. B2-5-7 TaxID=2589923 RepID=UPI00112DCFFB|nr:DUF5906 domain-containing protein [Mesorhizobium sp. B2-5-7]TPK17740.1 hypothetical protein FJ543_04325 [Mesorhizobium sp. B2-5-7]
MFEIPSSAAPGNNPDVPNVPEPLKALPQWIVWRLVQRPGEPKPTKLPYDPKTGQLASATDPGTWTDYATATVRAAVGGFNGIGFVFTPNDPFAFVDLDDCRDPITGEWMPYARDVVNMFPGASWETSQSGNGLHGIMRVGNKPAFANKARRWANNGNRFECYAEGRFVAFGKCDWTRVDIDDDCGEPLARWVPDRQSNHPGVIDWDDAARPDYAGPADDDELIRRAIGSKGGLAALGTAPPFAALWNGDAVELGKFFPDESRPFDHSAADLALANALAWWTGCNPVRMERLMSRAPLCNRDKWQKRGDYRARTITSAISAPNRKYLTAKDRRDQRLQADMVIGDDLPSPPLPKIMTLDQMRADLVHVGDGSQIVHRISKTIRSKDDAPSEYAASVTELDTGKVDRQGNPIMKQFQTLELWRREQSRTSVDVVTWQPGESEICKAADADQRAYNLWTAPRLMPAPANWHDWAKPFIDHVGYLVPNEAERVRFLQWLAHIVQRPGELPHTCYLMIATTTGIGRGTLASMLVQALRGYVAANADVGMLLNKAFNGRLSQKLLATVDEIREGNNSQRYQQQENFKSAVVEEHRHINPKFGRQRIEKNCCRWLLFSNHLDALPFDNSDRRVVVIENPTTPAAPAWFEYLHGIINHPAFIGSVQHYLATLDISTFKPGERAPMNAAKEKALAAMESAADQAARQFAATWPADLATVADLRDFMSGDAPSHAGAMRHVIERAGMKTARKIKIAAKAQTILIVRGALDPKDLVSADNAKVAGTIINAQTTFRSQ